jgi:hypothetical protein
VTLTVTGNTNSSRGVWRQIVSIYNRHRMTLTGSRWDIRWVSAGGKTPTFSVFPVFSVTVLEKCCDACGDREYYFWSGCLASQGARIPVASNIVIMAIDGTYGG